MPLQSQLPLDSSAADRLFFATFIKHGPSEYTAQERVSILREMPNHAYVRFFGLQIYIEPAMLLHHQESAYLLVVAGKQVDIKKAILFIRNSADGVFFPQTEVKNWL